MIYMVYLINGEKSLIDKEVNDLIKKYNTTSIIKYDLVFNKISDVINDINTVNLFSDKKVIICSSINNIDNIDILVKYLDNQNDNILILTNEDKIDLKILNKIKNKNIEKIDLSNIDLTSFIKEEFKDYKISFKEINMLKDYTSNDYNRIKEEIIKLKMYKLDTNEIKEDDIKFFGKIGINTPILFVFNKADKRTENDLKQILEKAKETLDDRGIEYFDIIAYSSFEEKEYFNINNKGLKAFLEFANGYTNNKENTTAQLNAIFKNIKTTYDEDMSKHEKIIADCKDVAKEQAHNITSVMTILSDSYMKMQKFKKSVSEVKKVEREIKSILYRMKAK